MFVASSGATVSVNSVMVSLLTEIAPSRVWRRPEENVLTSGAIELGGAFGGLLDGFGYSKGTFAVVSETGPRIRLETTAGDHYQMGYIAQWNISIPGDQRGRSLKGFHIAGTGGPGSYANAAILSAEGATWAPGFTWVDGGKADTGLLLGAPGTAISATNATRSDDVAVATPIHSSDASQYRFAILITSGPYHTDESVKLSADLVVTPIWEDANEVYTPGDPAKWESLDPGDPEVPETKREGLDLLVHTVVDLLDTVADLAAPGVKVVTEIEQDAWDYEVKPGDRHVYFDPSIDHAYTVGVSGLLGGVAFQETWLYNDSAVFNLEVETAFLVSPGQAMHIIWNGTTYTAHVLDAPTAL